MPKGKPNKRYTPEFKIMVVETMHKERLSHKEVTRQFEINAHDAAAKWERIYLEESKEGLYRRGAASSCGECIFKKIECLSCREGTAREKAQVIWELRHEHKVGLLIDIAGIPRSTC